MTVEELKKLSAVEIKALIYDEMVLIERGQANIRTLNQVLAEVSKPKEPVKE